MAKGGTSERAAALKAGYDASNKHSNMLKSLAGGTVTQTPPPRIIYRSPGTPGATNIDDIIKNNAYNQAQSAEYAKYDHHVKSGGKRTRKYKRIRKRRRTIRRKRR